MLLQMAYFIFFLILNFFNWKIIALQNIVGFCQTSTRISHRYTYVILFYGWIIFHYVYIQHIFFIHSSVDGSPVCVYVCVLVLSRFGHIWLFATPWTVAHPRPQLLSAAAKSFQSCPTLCDPIDSSPPGSPVPGILQARTLEWVAIFFSSAWKWKVKLKSLSRVRPSVTPCTAAFQAPPSKGFSRQEHWSGVPLPSPQLLSRAY